MKTLPVALAAQSLEALSWSGILIPALMAGVVATGVTVAIERWGGQLGGLIGTMPSTIVPASIGIAQQSTDAAAFEAAMYITPAGMFLNALFLYLWRALPPRLPQGWSLRGRLAAMTAVSLACWLVAALVMVLVVGALREQAAWTLPALGWGTTALIALVGVLACRKAPPAPGGRKPVSPTTLFARGALAAVAIGAAVFLATIGGPLAAGVAAVFPAIFLTTMVSLWISQGESVQVGAVGPMMLGSTSVAAFSVIAAAAIPALGTAPGVLVAWFGAVFGATVPAWAWLRRVRADA